MRYHKITKFDTANGPGIRSVLWVSGCNHKCKGCHNAITWDLNSGYPFTQDTLDQLIDTLRPDYIDGLTLSGGDPLHPENRDDVYMIIHTIKNQLQLDKTIWLYTGYRWEDIYYLPFIDLVDVIVDGRYIEEKRDITLPYCGSTNQRVIDVSKSLESGEVVLYSHNK